MQRPWHGPLGGQCGWSAHQAGWGEFRVCFYFLFCFVFVGLLEFFCLFVCCVYMCICVCIVVCLVCVSVGGCGSVSIAMSSIEVRGHLEGIHPELLCSSSG